MKVSMYQKYFAKLEVSDRTMPEEQVDLLWLIAKKKQDITLN